MPMEDIITSYLVQKKECSLPHLGSFKVIRHLPEIDPAANQIAAPVDEIIFSQPADNISGGLVQYMSSLESTSYADAEEKIILWCLNKKISLDRKAKIVLEPFGSLSADESGHIVFNRKKATCFYENLTASEITRLDAEHYELAKEKAPSGEADRPSGETPVKQKAGGKIIAIIVAAIALAILIYYFTRHPFTLQGISNHSTFEVKPLVPTYQLSK